MKKVLCQHHYRLVVIAIVIKDRYLLQVLCFCKKKKNVYIIYV